MSVILGVKFKKASKLYYYLPGTLNCKINLYVIANTPKGIFLGKIVKIIDNKTLLSLNQNEDKIIPIIKIADKNDIIKYKLNKKKAEEARQVFIKKIQKYNLNMKLISVEYTFDSKKVIFYFSAEGKVDFRELVQDLASILKVRIELRQIGVRDQSKILNGVGICGKPFCCSTFLSDFGTVSIKMAKDQCLTFNPTKFSGTCGRLMCCLQYEQNIYDELTEMFPKIGDYVETPDGVGVVVDKNLIIGSLKVLLNNDTDKFPKNYSKDKVFVIRNKY